MPKKTPAERLLSKRTPVAERGAEIIPGLSIGDRTRILKAIRNYETGELALDDARIAIAYTYTTMERIEEALETLAESEKELLRVIAEREITDEYSQAQKDIDLALSKSKSALTRIGMFTNLSKVVKTLVEQMEKQEKIKESRARQEFISIQKHSAVLSGMLTAFVAAMVEEGIEKPMRVGIFHRFKEFQERYPVIEESMDMIHKRLFAHPEEQAVVDADYTIVPTEDTYETAKSLVVKRVKHE